MLLSSSERQICNELRRIYGDRHGYNGSFNLDDLSTPTWSDAQYVAHDQAGLDLARRLKREMPDRQIYIWRSRDGNFGHTEVTSEDL